MKNTLTKFAKNLAAFVASLAKSNDHQQQPITLSMIGMELENDLTALRSRFAKVITKACGIVANWQFINRR